MRCTYGTHASALSAGGASGEAGGDEVEGNDIWGGEGRRVCVCVAV